MDHCESYQTTLKKWYSQLSRLALSIEGTQGSVKISVRSMGDGENMSLPSKNDRTPSKKRNFVLEGMPKRPPSAKYREKLNVFYTRALWVRTAVILFSLSCSHYGFLRKLIKNNFFSAPITEQNSLFFINITTRQQFFISVSESTKNMLKERFSNFFQVVFEIESIKRV